MFHLKEVFTRFYRGLGLRAVVRAPSLCAAEFVEIKGRWREARDGRQGMGGGVES